jgi:hypothetical protein
LINILTLNISLTKMNFLIQELKKKKRKNDQLLNQFLDHKGMLTTQLRK